MAETYAPEGWEKVAGQLYEALRDYWNMNPDPPREAVVDWWHETATPAMNAYWAARNDGSDGD